MLRLFFSGAAAITVAMPAAANPTKVEPAGQWHVNYADDSCRLSRIFGADKTRTVLMIDRFEPSENFQFLVASKLLTQTRLRSSVKVRFGPGEDEQTYQYIPATLQDMPAVMGRSVILGFKPDEAAAQAALAKAKAEGDEKAAKAMEFMSPMMPMTAEREAAITYLEIRGVSSNPVVLDLGAMDQPMAALRACTDELLSHWGIDVGAHKALSRRATPKSNPGKWISSSDYPTKLINMEVEGLIQFRLTIDENGQVSDCHIQQSTRPVEFDQTVCRVMSKNGRFDPALDVAGKPIKSYWRSSIRFRIP